MTDFTCCAKNDLDSTDRVVRWDMKHSLSNSDSGSDLPCNHFTTKFLLLYYNSSNPWDSIEYTIYTGIL